MSSNSSPAASMMAVTTIGIGGYEKLVYGAVPLPRVSPGDVLLRVLAAGVNNTDINTRVGWYSPSVKDGTSNAVQEEAGEAIPVARTIDGGWDAATPFPLIQGTDCCGCVVSVGAGVDPSTIGSRVLVRPCTRPAGFGSVESVWLGSDIDGAFAQFLKVPASEVFRVESTWSDVELGAVPCAYGTAENMLQRAGVVAGEHVLVMGASGGVGSAAVQLAKRRGAVVTAVCGPAKAEAVRSLGADRILDRSAEIAAALGPFSVDVIIDNVAGVGFGDRVDVLKRGGRLVTSGAIAGPIVTLDLRTVYLRDLRLIGCTAWDAAIFPNLIGYIERGELQPPRVKVFPLESIADAQREFLDKLHTGKLVLVPPLAAS